MPLVVPFDHHANITQTIIDAVDALVGYRTQPHDQLETGKAAAKILFSIIRGDMSPTIAWRKIPMMAHQEQFLTSRGPMKEWFDLARHNGNTAWRRIGFHLPHAALAGCA